MPQLTCRRAQLSSLDDSWPSYHFSVARAQSALDTIEAQLNQHFAYQDDDGVWKVLIRGEQTFCYTQPWGWIND
jgi:hypothetical protein